MLIICVWIKTQTSRNTFHVTCCVKTVQPLPCYRWLKTGIHLLTGSSCHLMVLLFSSWSFLQKLEKTIKCWCFPSSIYIISLPFFSLWDSTWLIIKKSQSFSDLVVLYTYYASLLCYRHIPHRLLSLFILLHIPDWRTFFHNLNLQAAFLFPPLGFLLFQLSAYLRSIT